MSLRTKLTVGIGFLFVLIFSLALYSSYQIQRLSKDADSILRDNYDSLVYCKNMLVALDDMQAVAAGSIFGAAAARLPVKPAQFFESSKSNFEANLKAEENNITEPHEREYVAELEQGYGLFLKLCQQVGKAGTDAAFYFNEIMPAYSNTRRTVIGINDLNMQAIERKNLMTRHNAANMIISLAVVGAILIILAFFYFWYFPFYISNTMAYLSKRMKELLDDAGIRIDTRTKDEAFILLRSIDLLQSRLAESREKRAVKRVRRTRS
jgi:NtrC-family two-component system sensor histidine kinase KinB